MSGSAGTILYTFVAAHQNKTVRTNERTHKCFSPSFSKWLLSEKAEARLILEGTTLTLRLLLSAACKACWENTQNTNRSLATQTHNLFWVSLTTARPDQEQVGKQMFNVLCVVNGNSPEVL